MSNVINILEAKNKTKKEDKKVDNSIHFEYNIKKNKEKEEKLKLERARENKKVLHELNK